MARHVLQTQALRAELHFIGAVELGLAAFEFDGERGLDAVAGGELHEIGDACDVQPSRGQRQRGDAPDAALRPAHGFVGMDMQRLALGGESIFRPEPFEMNQRRLPQAIDGMLQRGEGNGFAERRSLRLVHPRALTAAR